jgi:hypothetical protein
VVRETVGAGAVVAAGITAEVDVVVVAAGEVCAEASTAPAKMKTMMARDRFFTRVLDLGETLEISSLHICCGMRTGMKRTRRHRPLVISRLRQARTPTDCFVAGNQ